MSETEGNIGDILGRLEVAGGFGSPDPKKATETETEPSPLLAARKNYYEAGEQLFKDELPPGTLKDKLKKDFEQKQRAYAKEQAAALAQWSEENKEIVEKVFASLPEPVNSTIPAIYKDLLKKLETQPEQPFHGKLYSVLGAISDQTKLAKEDVEPLFKAMKEITQHVLDVTVLGQEMVDQTIGDLRAKGAKFSPSRLNIAVVTEVVGITVIPKRTVKDIPLSGSPISALIKAELPPKNPKNDEAIVSALEASALADQFPPLSP